MPRVFPWVAAVMGAGLWAVAAPAQEASYRLAENDQLRLIAPGAPGIAGTYLLGEDGRIALPVAGPVLLQGLTLDEAAEAVRVALATEIVAPQIGVELVEQRPFYITGDVAAPGAYPGVSGLTVARAVALAGGDRRNVDSDRLQLAVTDIRGREELDRALREQTEAAIRLARLQAELAGDTDFTPPPAPAGITPDLAAEMAAREKATLAAATAAHAARLDSIARLLETRAAEIAALEGRIDSGARQTELIEQEIVDARDLVGRGLAPVARLNGLLREADRQQSDILQMRVLLNQALQAVAQLQLDQANTPREREIALTQAIAETSSRLATARLSVAAAAELIAESGTPAAAAPGLRRVVFRIERADGATVIETEDGTVPVLPGDLVTVLRVMAPGAAGP